jgi:hypothetical protein
VDAVAKVGWGELLQTDTGHEFAHDAETRDRRAQRHKREAPSEQDADRVRTRAQEAGEPKVL